MAWIRSAYSLVLVNWDYFFTGNAANTMGVPYRD